MKEEVILDQMEETRTSLSEKLERLEEQVAGSMHSATSAVAEQVGAVKDAVEGTVSDVKSAVQGAYASVADCVHSSVGAVKAFLDVPGHVDRHPWPALGAAVMAGYVAGALLKKDGHASGQPGHKSASLFAGLFSHLVPEISKLKGVALGSLVSTVREKVMQAVPEEYAPKLNQFFDGISEKIGAEAKAPEKNEPKEERDDSEFPKSVFSH